MLGVKTDNIPQTSALEGLRKLRIHDDWGLTYLVDNLLLAQECEDHEVYRLLRKEIRRYQRSENLLTEGTILGDQFLFSGDNDTGYRATGQDALNIGIGVRDVSLHQLFAHPSRAIGSKKRRAVCV